LIRRELLGGTFVVLKKRSPKQQAQRKPLGSALCLS
jgi:hypothetical protein